MAAKIKSASGKVQTAYNSARSRRTHAEQYARAASAYAQEAEAAAKAGMVEFPSQEVYESARSALEAGRRNAVTARQASLRADIALIVAQEAVDTARTQANEIAKANDPVSAGVAVPAALAAENKSKSAASNSMKDADAAKEAALAAGRARDQVLVIVKGSARPPFPTKDGPQ